MYVKNAMTLADAKQIAAAAEAEALKNNWRVTIAVLDDGGNLLFLQRLDEAPLGSIVVAQEKARTALLFKRPTKVFEEIIASGRTAMLTLPGDRRIGRAIAAGRANRWGWCRGGGEIVNEEFRSLNGHC
jgi:uncharacterized protein GlcG (DUF336 family)